MYVRVGESVGVNYGVQRTRAVINGAQGGGGGRVGGRRTDTPTNRHIKNNTNPLPVHTHRQYTLSITRTDALVPI